MDNQNNHLYVLIIDEIDNNLSTYSNSIHNEILQICQNNEHVLVNPDIFIDENFDKTNLIDVQQQLIKHLIIKLEKVNQETQLQPDLKTTIENLFTDNKLKLLSKQDYDENGYLTPSTIKMLKSRIDSHKEFEQNNKEMAQHSLIVPNGLNIYHLIKEKSYNEVKQHLNRITSIRLFLSNNNGELDWEHLLRSLHMIYPNIENQIYERSHNVYLTTRQKDTLSLPFPILYFCKPKNKKFKIDRSYHKSSLNYKWQPYKENVGKAKAISHTAEYCLWFNKYCEWIGIGKLQMNPLYETMLVNGYNCNVPPMFNELGIPLSKYSDFQVGFNQWLHNHEKWCVLHNEIMKKLNEENNPHIQMKIKWLNKKYGLGTLPFFINCLEHGHNHYYDNLIKWLKTLDK